MFRPKRHDGECNDNSDRDFKEPMQGEMVHAGAERGMRTMIENWIVQMIDKYKFQFKPLNIKGNDANVVLAMEVIV